MDELLFNDGELRLALEAQAQRMRGAIEAEAEEILRQVDAEQWAEALATHFAVSCPDLQTGDLWRNDVQDITIRRQGFPGVEFGDPYSGEVSIPGYRIAIHVPFLGEADVFKLRPSSFTFNPPRGRVQGGDVVLTIEYARAEQPDIDVLVNDRTRTISEWLGFARADVTSFNDGLKQQARQAIDERQRRIEQRDAHLARSTIPIRRLGEPGKTYIPEVLVRRPAPSLPKKQVRDKPPALEPVLEERIFEHILGVIRMQARQMEQSPGTYSGMGEEARRDTLVATLNTHYEGRAHAEAFNHAGKTDILIRYEGRNLFICECKFWSGPKGFTDTTDQLFRYAGWRDTKLAIVMFVRTKGLTGVLENAKATLEAHPQFVAWKEAEETELRATMHWTGDRERLADLNVFFVHLP
jgi:hypothetical protein